MPLFFRDGPPPTAVDAIMSPQNGPRPFSTAELRLPHDAEPTMHLRILNGRLMQLWLTGRDIYGDREAWWIDVETGHRP